MPIITVVFGMLLIGVGGYFFNETRAPTALIPAWMGLALALLGLLALKDRLRKHAMHAAVLIGLVGCIATASMGLPNLFILLKGGTVDRPNAAYSQSITAGICLVFVILCVNSFIQARLRRKANPGA